MNQKQFLETMYDACEHLLQLVEILVVPTSPTSVTADIINKIIIEFGPPIDAPCLDHTPSWLNISFNKKHCTVYLVNTESNTKMYDFLENPIDHGSQVVFLLRSLYKQNQSNIVKYRVNKDLTQEQEKMLEALKKKTSKLFEKPQMTPSFIQSHI